MRTSAVLLGLSLAACSTPEKASVDIKLYATYDHDDLLTAAGPADVIEMVVIHSDDPVRSQRKADLQVASRSGKMPSLESGEGLRIYVRGFFGGDGPLFYGASAPFDAPSDSVSVQVGPTDCVTPNRATPLNPHPAGNEDMKVQRVGHTLTELGDGRILIVGGARIAPDESPSEVETSFEVFDPALSQFYTLGQLNEPRAWHTATLLTPTRVLVVGGINGAGADGVSVSTTAAVIDVSTTVATVTTLAGPFDTGDERYRHRADRLRDGSVLIAGGLGPTGAPLATTWRFFPGDVADPRAGRFEQQGRLAEARSEHTLTALLDRGNEPAVVAGGLGVDGALASIEVFTTNPQQGGCVNDQRPSVDFGCWIRPTGRVLQRARFGHRAVRVGVDREKVLWVGGFASEDRAQFARELEMLDEGLEVVSGGDSLEFGRGDLAAVRLADGDVVVAGGRSGDAPHGVVTRLRRRENADEGFVAVAVDPQCDLSEARWGLQAVRLTTGTVLFAGGVSVNAERNKVATRRAAIYFPRVVDLSTVYPGAR